jgi:hypothetical protein
MTQNTYFRGEICTKGLLSRVGNLLAFQKNANMLDLEAQFQGHVIQDGHRKPKFHLLFGPYGGRITSQFWSIRHTDHGTNGIFQGNWCLFYLGGLNFKF